MARANAVLCSVSMSDQSGHSPFLHILDGVTKTAVLPDTHIADWLNISTRTLQRIVRAGDIKPMYVGKSPRFTLESVREYLARPHQRGRERR